MTSRKPTAKAKGRRQLNLRSALDEPSSVLCATCDYAVSQPTFREAFREAARHATEHPAHVVGAAGPAMIAAPKPAIHGPTA